MARSSDAVKLRRKFRPRETARLFLPDYLTEVKMVAMRGLSDKDMAAVFGVRYSLFKKWKAMYPSFKDALDKGRLRADAEVVAALFKRATGKFSLKETKIIKYKDDFETLDVDVHYPPDVEAIKYWLNNRARENWQQRSAVEASGPGGKAIEIATNKTEMIDAILQMVKPKPDGDDSTGQSSDRDTRKANKKGSKKKA